MEKTVVLLVVVSLSMIVACSGFDKTLHHNKTPEQRAAKLRKKAAELEQRAALLTNQPKNKCLNRDSIDAINAAGKTSLYATDIRNNCKSSGSLQLKDVAIGGKCTTAGDATFDQVTITGSVRTAGDARIVNSKIVGKCVTSGDACIDTTTVGSNCMTSGDASLKNVTVAGNVTASGQIVLRDCQLQQAVAVSGSASMVNTKISGDVSLTGKLAQFEHCSCKALTLCPRNNSKTLFKSSSLANITVHNHGSSWTFCGFTFKSDNRCKRATIELDATTIYGDVLFKELTGTVVLRNGAQVTGQVIGGHLVKE